MRKVGKVLTIVFAILTTAFAVLMMAIGIQLAADNYFSDDYCKYE